MTERDIRDYLQDILITGMRDKVSHAYFGVKSNVLWDTTQQDLKRLKPVIQKMLINQLEGNTQESDKN